MASNIFQAVAPEHLQLVRTLFREYGNEMPMYVRLGDFEREIATLPGAYAPPQGRLLLATVAGQPVGCIALRPFLVEGVCEMKRLYVRPPFRGARLGIELIERLLEEARLAGYSCIRLDTYPTAMESAVAVYKRFGFQEVDAAPLSAVEGLSYMELKL